MVSVTSCTRFTAWLAVSGVHLAKIQTLKQNHNTPGMADATVSQEDILGRVTRISRNGRDVRLGLGPERRLIAVFSRAVRLFPVLSRLARPFARRSLP
jgi:hypothetical protein